MKKWYVYHDNNTKVFKAKQMNKEGIYFSVPLNEDVIRKYITKEKALIYAEHLNKQVKFLK